jgi:O-antigen ligase
MNRVTLERWWWPAFVLVYPLMFWNPGSQTRLDAEVIRFFLTGIALVGGLTFELTAHPYLRLHNLIPQWSTLRSHPVPVFALAFGIWSVVIACFSSSPGFALAGGIDDMRGSAIWMLTLSLITLFVYLHSLRVPGALERIAGASVLGGSTLAILACIEVLTRHGLFYNVGADTLPMVTFPQKGHLAGFMTLIFGLAIRQIVLQKHWGWVAIILTALCIGLAFNRASLIGMGLVILLVFLKSWRMALAIIIVTTVSITCGWGLTKTFNSSAARVVEKTNTLEIRQVLWSAAWRAALASPLIGWPEGLVGNWATFLSVEELKLYFKSELNENFQERFGDLFIVKTADGELKQERFSTWAAHNQFLDIASQRGLVGLFLYCVMLFIVLRRRPWHSGVGLGLLAYHAFLMFWFLIPESEGVVWALFGLTGLTSKAFPNNKHLI